MEDPLAALREEIRGAGARLSSARLRLIGWWCVLGFPAALILRRVWHTPKFAVAHIVAAVVTALVFGATPLIIRALGATPRRRLLGRCQGLTSAERAALVQPLADDANLPAETRWIIAPLLREPRASEPAPAVPPDGRGDEATIA
jgi:hypothetical protein